ncbi:MAG: molybdopterin-dependent oxidoreductase [Chloroflexi bacterium]|nr:molybdopterin-dependent oxidoreductase [Chloroflexota bacterium]
MTATSAPKLFGSRQKRKEDPRLITGRATYVDDVKLPSIRSVVMVRSPHAHARVRSIDVAAARATPGVVAVYTGADFGSDLGELPCGFNLPNSSQINPTYQPVVKDRARFVGNIVAVVVGDSEYAARDGAERIAVDYDVMPAVVDQIKALEPGAPLVHDNVPNNTSFVWHLGAGTADSALASAPVRLRQRILNQRLIPNAMETRGVLAQYNGGTEELTIWTSTQVPHLVRLLTGLVTGLPEHRIRVIAPEVGGGFGSKLYLYAEELIVSYLARHLGQPCKWIETRSEAYIATTHGRDQVQDIEVAATREGVITGLKVVCYANIGAYHSLFAPGIPTILFGLMLSGQYKVPAVDCKVYGVLTNTVPVDAYRGAGRPEATHLIERIVDIVADEIGVDPAEVRRRNFIGPDEFPYTTCTGVIYDSGNYAPALDQALATVGYADIAAAKAAASARGKLLGIGMSTYIEICGLAPSKVLGAVGGGAGGWESAAVRVHPTGKVTVFTGSSTQGQGHETSFAQIVADDLGIAFDDIEVVHGDTNRVQMGIGTFGSRSMAVGGAAMKAATGKIVDKARKVAAHLLEVAEGDLDFESGVFRVKGAPDRSKTIQDVALMAFLAHNWPEGLEPGLEAQAFFDPSNFTWPFGAHVAVVEIDAATGHVALQRYVAVDDCGNVINPLLADGQVHGGITQGAAQALYEGAVYDDQGQLLTGSMMDYVVPRASYLPTYETAHTVTPSPVNPLGVKGIGEAGTIASSAAVINAVVDALSHLGVRHVDMPVRSERIWQILQGGTG